MWSAIRALLQSRKFFVTGAAVTVCAVLAVMGKLPLDEFIKAVTQLAAVLTAAIAFEDYGKSRASTAVFPPVPPASAEAVNVTPIGTTRG